VSNWPVLYGPGPGGYGLPVTYVYLPPTHRSSTAHLVFAWLAAVLSGLYMLPWAIGATRNRTNCVAIALVNFFLGWTLVGWVVALVLACGPEPVQQVVVRSGPPPYQQPPYLRPPAPLPYDHFSGPAHATRTDAGVPAGSSASEVTMPLPTHPPHTTDHRWRDGLR
jgi:Superinfection immunity protein